VAKVVLDASALLAYLRSEKGADRIASNIGDAIISAVNHAEVVSKLILRGATLPVVQKALGYLDLDVVDFDRDLAEASGDLIAQTKGLGLSLGDRACLALAARESLPVLTTDRAWSSLDIGVEVQLVR
jgi:PIN domain nuclease of toxin-antitoxin system